MARTRITGPERKASILAAARRVFSRTGFDNAKTSDVAREADVSEALVFRHFPSKLALYRAVLRQIIREQDENFAEFAPADPSAASIIHGIKAYFSHAASLREDEMQQRFRLLLASLTADGAYARLVSRRSRRMIDRSVDTAMERTKDDGDIPGELLSVNDTSLFIEHIGTMMSAIVAIAGKDAPYSVTGDALVRQVVWFCCRGLGFSDEAIARHIDD
ncbi:TetR/AcrR family transcriptional regulator [Parafrankia sp. BMG5.11]|uniref:TetR/AcrR family transcriptional regulator n=1 Tax=Parafrankia sp. BMG5.11 TaxID=222540 RepID=UPI00103F8615|nr:TetR/AcrR family transcriptional regulator [Parafrankia sp. BMG5.11]TCJ37058.1 TetR/AcrR family transcriptional regulator [Parafrankia sp. BMG5.11]